MIDNFLSDDDANLILEEAISLKDNYTQGTVGDNYDGGKRKVILKYKKNSHLNLDVFIGDNPGKLKMVTLLKSNLLMNAQVNILLRKGHLIFSIIPLATSFKFLLQRWVNGDNLIWHQDLLISKSSERIVSMNYYVNKVPKKFTGGKLCFRSDDIVQYVEPKHNRLVIFPSDIEHSVTIVKTESTNLADHRYSITGWMGFK